MDFLKKHYEKVLLGLVLLGLAVAIAFLPFKISSERQKLEDLRTSLTHPKVKALTNLDLALAQTALRRVATQISVDFTTTNKVFNPVPWQRASDGHLIKLEDRNIGPKAVSVAKSVPLYLTLTLDQVTTAVDGTPKYVVGVQKDNAATAAQRSKKQSYCKVGDKTDVFTLREVKGKPDDPSQLILILNDTSETAVLTRDQPFRRVDGYMADLAYKPENKTWVSKRVGNAISFNNEEYNIVAITRNEVVLSAKSNQKKWTVTYNAAPAS
jgi:hypothetical protein